MTLIKQYIRNKKRNRIGIMVGFEKDGKIYYGWSRCNRKDKFDKTRGFGIASARAFRRHGNNNFLNIPQSIRLDLARFICRCNRYFHLETNVFEPPAWMSAFLISTTHYDEASAVYETVGQN